MVDILKFTKQFGQNWIDWIIMRTLKSNAIESMHACLHPFKSGKIQNIERCCCKKYLIQVWLSSQDIRARARATRESIYREWWGLLLCFLRSLFFRSSIPQKCTKCTTVSYRSGGSLIRWAVLSRHLPTPPQAQIHTQTISRMSPLILYNQSFVSFKFIKLKVKSM